MVIRIPKWLLFAFGGALLIAAGVAIGLLLNGNRDPAGTSRAAVALPRCNESEAKLAVQGSPLAEELTSSGSSLEDVFEFFTPELIGCRDLNNDGTPEMVVQLLGQTGAAPRPWAIFSAYRRGWRLSLSRRRLQSELRFRGEMIEESIPAFAEGDRYLSTRMRHPSLEFSEQPPPSRAC